MVTLAELEARENKQSQILKRYNQFFHRVLYIAAVRVHEMCKTLNISVRVGEMIWSVVKVLLAQESDLLIDRHLDHVIICTIYGMCRVHSPSCFEGDAPKPDISSLFSHITDAYMSTSRQRTVGRSRLSQI